MILEASFGLQPPSHTSACTPNSGAGSAAGDNEAAACGAAAADVPGLLHDVRRKNAHRPGGPS